MSCEGRFICALVAVFLLLIVNAIGAVEHEWSAQAHELAREVAQHHTAAVAQVSLPERLEEGARAN